MKPENDRRLRRLDCPRTGVLVWFLGRAGEGYCKVQSLNGKITYETRTERLHIPIPQDETSRTT